MNRRVGTVVVCGVMALLPSMGGASSDPPSPYSFEVQFVPPVTFQVTRVRGTSWSSMRIGCQASPCIAAIDNVSAASASARSESAADVRKHVGIVLLVQEDPTSTLLTCNAKRCQSSAAYPDGSSVDITLGRAESKAIATPLLVKAVIENPEGDLDPSPVVPSESGDESAGLDLLKNLDNKIVVNFQGMSVLEALKIISRVGAFRLAVSESVQDSKITLNEQESTIKGLLVRLAEEKGLVYSVPKPDLLVVKAKRPS